MQKKEKRKFFNRRLEKKRLVNSFRHAYDGLVAAYASEQNLCIHTLVAILVVIFGFIFKISYIEWLICLILIGLVITAELFNTTFENMVDMACPQIDPQAKKIKDTASAAVLVFSIIAAVIGLMIFIPKIISLIGGLS